MPKSKKRHQGRVFPRKGLIDTHMNKLLIVHTWNMPAAQPLFDSKYRLSWALEQAVIHASFDIRQHRTILLAKILRNEKGEEYLQAEEYEADPCIPDEAADQFTEALEQVTHNKKHLIGDAYIVANGLINIPEDLAEKLFRAFGAWDGEALWEKQEAA